MSLQSEYLWIVIVGALAAFFTAYGIGANDVANAFGTSVGARTLTLKQALLIAAFAEFGGAVLLGSHVTATVAGGIADVNAFQSQPEVYMYGMLAALVASGTWLIIATYYELPVSTTHSIVGAVIGFALVYRGAHSVRWSYKLTEFPFVGGVVAIVVSWVVSPLLAGIVAAAGFAATRTAVLRRRRSVQLSFILLPLLVLLTVWVNLFFVLNKGNAKALKDMSAATAAWISAASAAGAAVLTAVFVTPLLRRRVMRQAAAVAAARQSRDEESGWAAAAQPPATELPPVRRGGASTSSSSGGGGGGGGRASSAALVNSPSAPPAVVPGVAAAPAGPENAVGLSQPSAFPVTGAAVYPPPTNAEEATAAAAGAAPAVEISGSGGGGGGGNDVGTRASKSATPSPSSSTASSLSSWARSVGKVATYGTRVDIHQVVLEDEAVQNIHNHAEVFDPAAEHSFKFLQVFTATCVSFAHGANDVANSVGPFAAIYAIYTTGQLSSSASTPTWVLALGGAGIVVGLGTYGYNIIRVLGVKSVAMTPSRGYIIELATALVVVVGSRYGLPLSTTHCQVGGTVGVGMLEGVVRGVNWPLALRFIGGWVLTLVVAGLLSAALFAQGAYAPRA